jgi:hypothetical protein
MASNDRGVCRRPAAFAAAALVAAASASTQARVMAARCTVLTDFEVRAIPSGYEDATADVFAAGVPRGAKRIRVRFVRPASGKPVGADAFPLQRWSSRVRGFRPDGTVWVQIRLAGYGYGMPAARSSRWRAVVTYDC